MKGRFLMITFVFCLLPGWLLADTTSDSSKKDTELRLALFFAGHSSLENQNDIAKTKYEGLHVEITGIDFLRVTDLRPSLGYRYGNPKNKTNLPIYMPEVSLNLDTNILALPTIRRALPELFDLVLMGGGGVGVTYAPFNITTERDSCGYLF